MTGIYNSVGKILMSKGGVSWRTYTFVVVVIRSQGHTKCVNGLVCDWLGVYEWLGVCDCLGVCDLLDL